MSDYYAYRITQSGGVENYYITIGGSMRTVYGITPPEPIPDWLGKIIRVRRLIADPSIGDFFLVEGPLPDEGVANTAYVMYGSDYYNGIYYVWRNGVWIALLLVNPDTYIRGLIETMSVESAAKYLIQNAILHIDAVYRITSESDGGQSMSFASLSDLIAWFNAQLTLLDDMTMKRKTISKRKMPFVGYVPDPWGLK
ncbi:hypothetical protein FACS1894151_08080 [Spirochaetia bacterium]|nr:hypothetical protein FACS1894151_08080 [Spirochaetia bacterium]